MFKGLNLQDNCEIRGTSQEELNEVLSDKDARTEMYVLDPKDVSFAIVDEHTPVDDTLRIVPPIVNNGYGKQYSRVPIDRYYFNKMETPIQDEAINSSVFLMETNREGTKQTPVPVSAEAIKSLQSLLSVGGSGEVVNPTMVEHLAELVRNEFDKIVLRDGKLETVKDGRSTRERYKRKKNVERLPMMEMLGMDPDALNNKKNNRLTVVLMKDKAEKGIRKVFSFRSGKYTRIQQTAVMEILRNLDGLTTEADEDGKTLPKYEMRDWTVTHFMTEANISFDSVAEQFSTMYNLKEKVIPCFRINTSDTGNSSLRITKHFLCSLGTEEVYLSLPHTVGEMDYVLSRHYGKTDIENLVSKLNRDVFGDFKAIPENLSKIALMGMAETEKVLRIAFNAMQLQTNGVIINKKLEERIVSQMAAMLPKYESVYDTLYYVLYASENEDIDLTDNQREELRSKALMATFATAEYEQAAEEAEALKMSAEEEPAI